jgi:hypothetical protein
MKIPHSFAKYGPPNRLSYLDLLGLVLSALLVLFVYAILAVN